MTTAEATAGTLNYPVFPKQAEATRLADQVDQFFFGGAKGPGKSEWIIIYAILYALRYPGSSAYVFRRNYPELRRTLINRFQKLAPRDLYTWNAEAKTATWHNGSETVFVPCDSLADAENYQGAEANLLAIDELTLLEPEVIQVLKTCNRGARPDIPIKFIAASNPLGPGHDWTREFFVDPSPPGTPFSVTETVETEIGAITATKTRAFLPAGVTDNLYLMAYQPEYVIELNNLPEPKRSAWLYGNWDYHEGAFFAAWSREKHVVEPWEPPPEWRCFRAVDFGGTDPSVCLWLTADPETGRLFVYRELRERGLTTGQFKAQIAALSGDHYHDYTVADTAGRAKSAQTRLSQWDIFAGEPYPILLTEAQKARVPGWSRLRDLLQPLPDGKPGLQVMSNCVWLIKEFPAALTDDKNNEDIAEPSRDDKRRDDCLDTLRYAAMSRGALRRASTKKKPKPGEAPAWRRMAFAGR